MKTGRFTNKYKGIYNFLKSRLHIKNQVNRLIYVLAILVLLLILKRLNNSISNNIIQIIDKGVNYEFSIRKDGKVVFDYGKKLLVLPEKALSVFNKKDIHKYPPPVDGSIYNPFGEVRYLDGRTSFNNGVDIIPKDEKEPVSIEKGTVKKIEDKKTKGYFVTIDHDNMITVYGYLTRVYITEDEKIIQGDKIGTLGTNKDGNKYLHFEIWVDGSPVNPLDYIGFNSKL